MSRVSVIIPIFGVEKYIERCVRSLFSQTLDELEFIFIDDCTRDNSIIILDGIIDEYKEQINNNHWTIIREKMKVNSGLPAVRKRGIELSTGDYILHCDSDDWMDNNMISEMWNLANDRALDIVICDYYEASDKERVSISGAGKDINTAFLDIFKSYYSWALWNKLVKRTVYDNKIVFPKTNIGEDMALTLQLLYYAKRIGHVPKPLYFYYKNPSSMTQINTEEHTIRNMLQWKENVHIVERFFCNQSDKQISDSVTFIKYKVKSYLLPILHNRSNLRLWKDTFPEINYLVYLSPYLSCRNKINFLLTYLGFCPSWLNPKAICKKFPNREFK